MTGDATAAPVPGAADGAPAYRWLGHGTVFLPGPPRLLVDPWRRQGAGPRADAVLVTQDAIDHCAPDDVAAALAPAAPVLAPGRAAALLRPELGERVRTVAPGDRVVVGDALVRVLPAAGPARGGRPPGFLPPGRGVAFLIESGGRRVLCLGDSVPLAEHAGLAPDLAFVAVGGLVTATPEEAAESARTLGARLLVPVHWGDLEARFPAAARFVALCRATGLRAETPHPAGSRRGGARTD